MTCPWKETKLYFSKTLSPIQVGRSWTKEFQSREAKCLLPKLVIWPVREPLRLNLPQGWNSKTEIYLITERELELIPVETQLRFNWDSLEGNGTLSQFPQFLDYECELNPNWSLTRGFFVDRVDLKFVNPWIWSKNRSSLLEEGKGTKEVTELGLRILQWKRVDEIHFFFVSWEEVRFFLRWKSNCAVRGNTFARILF